MIMRFEFLFIGCILAISMHAQVRADAKDLKFKGIQLNGQSYSMTDRPLFSLILNDAYYESDNLPGQLEVKWSASGHHYSIVMTNISKDTLSLKNILPLAAQMDHVYITGLGDHPLSRTHLFVPGYNPVNVIVPDNVWNLGYASLKINDSVSMYTLTRRKSWDRAERKRFETILYPQGSVLYDYFVDTFSGVWQEGLRTCFQRQKLYDMDAFDDSMYHRTDLHWIQQSKMIHLLMAWDDRLYDRKKNKYVLNEFIAKAKLLYGGDDIIGIWPTWPALGMDQRNQWDLYRDLPGGIKGLSTLVDQAHQQKVKIFISYNPWDESTRKEDHLRGMADLVKNLDADGVILDTRGASSKELQEAVDKVKPGVIMYSEGMAVPKDMESIVAGRVHNALYYPPILNLNKLIKPDFGIFRVAEVYKEPIRREIHAALFNGYGIEFNVFRPGQPEGLDDQYRYLGKALRILREHSDNFSSPDWQPLFPSKQEGVLINFWPGITKDIYTVYNANSVGFSGVLMNMDTPVQGHFVDLWNHEEININPYQRSLSISLDPYPLKDQGTNNEGSVGVIARFDSVLKVKHIDGDHYAISSSSGSHILIWAGKPDYSKNPTRFMAGALTVNLHQLFPGWDDDFIVQSFDSLQLIDERIIKSPPASPYLISRPDRSRILGADQYMVLIPSDSFTWTTTHGDEFIPYPENGRGQHMKMKSFYMDKHPVTNAEYEVFLNQSKYKPIDKTNFLKHWVLGKIPNGLEQHPVVYVSHEDALAYCKWKGARLPTETEWQYAAQTSGLHSWPWGEDAGIRQIQSEVITETLTHTVFDTFDSTYANPGNGILDPVGKYPKGTNPFGLTDLVGSVWQMTADQYQSGSYRYLILKGGSYFKPTASWWYVQGGPQPLSWRQMWLKVSEGYERSSTVGFRCMRDMP